MTAGPAASPVLTTSSTVSCKHGGVVSAAGDAKLKVGASSVLTRADVVGKGISGCLTVDNAQTSTLQCRWVSSVSSGTSSKLKVGAPAAPVLLETLAGSTNGTPPPTGAELQAVAKQSKLVTP